MSCNPPFGVMLSEEELHDLYLCLTQLVADDLISEDRRQRALTTVYLQWLDCRRVTSPQAPRSHGDSA